MSIAAPVFTARLSIQGDRIVLEGTPPEANEFAHSLPDARWHAKQRCWSCLLTPAAAWRVVGQVARHDAANCAKPVAALAANYAVRLSNAAYANGHDMPQPTVHKTKNWDHQRQAFWFANVLPATLLAEQMGCGKSLTAVDLVVNWNCRTTLILCPKSVRGVWLREFQRHAARAIQVLVLDKGTVAIRTRQAAEFLDRCRRLGGAAVVVVNYESAWRSEFAKWSLGHDWDCVILDEAHRIKAHDSSVSKYCAKLGMKGQRRLALTGTPLAHSPLDVFGIFRFLDPGFYGTSWWHFANRYARKDNPSIPQQITGYKHQDELAALMGRITFQCKAADVLDLPPVQHIDLPCELNAAATRAYGDLENEFITEVQGGTVTAANALVKLLRLQQLTSGFAVLDDSRAVEVLDDGKQTALCDLLADLPIDDPAVVFCRFRQDLASVKAVAEKLGRRYGELSGDRRDGLTASAEMVQGVDLLAVQIASGGVGIDLTRAHYGVYYSVGMSLAEYDQSIARLHRPGQTQNTTFYHLVVPGTVDSRIYTAFAKRREIIEAVLSAFSQRRIDVSITNKTDLKPADVEEELSKLDKSYKFRRKALRALLAVLQDEAETTAETTAETDEEKGGDGQ